MTGLRDSGLAPRPTPPSSQYESFDDPRTRAVVALTELRGWALAAPKRESAFLLPRIDAALDGYGDGVANLIARISGDALEGRGPSV